MRPLLLCAALAFAGACRREGALDTVVDTSASPDVWKRDADAMAGALPRSVGSFTPREAVQPFTTSYRTGPVFGASCVYADGHRQVLLRVETGNIAELAKTALDPKGDSQQPAGQQTMVHQFPAVTRWNDPSLESQVAFVVSRRYLVHLRVEPAKSASEALALAEAFDPSALQALALEGVK